ncbi:MAG: glycosyltransferase family 4 protein [Gemmataceae bacterium]|nr:glycosyltransferase family 4 protein [Gemmataceae bacterium]
MKIAYITAGAAGNFCGSCMRDNTLVAALQKFGHDALLIPTYTPIRTDEKDVSTTRVFFGGINVYLQQKLSLFRHTPWTLDRLFDFPALLRWVSRFAVRTQAEDLGDLTLSVLQGEHGRQRKEIEKLVRWLADEVRPQLVVLTNVLLSGLVHRVKEILRVPVVATLQGDDIFLEALPPDYRARSIDLIRDHNREIDGFIATSRYYADFMAGYLGTPRDRTDVVYPGLNLKGHGGPRPSRHGPPVVGYFARVCPEKGFHALADAFRALCAMPGAPQSQFLASGWLGENDRPYFEEVQQRLHGSGLAHCFRYLESPDHESKVRFFHAVDVLSVPTVYREPKGLYVLEALANGVPVVQPAHGSFPELIELTGGGLLVKPEDPHDLAHGLRRLLEDETLRRELGERGKDVVWSRFTAESMARATAEVFGKYL